MLRPIVAPFVSLFLLAAGCATAPSGPTFDGARIWHVKAIRADGSFVDVKAVDTNGALLDVKALETPGNLHMMDVKALRAGRALDVKLLPAVGDRHPLRAIDAGGNVLEVVGLPQEGGRLPIAGMRASGNLIHVKAADISGSLLGVKAIAPDGRLMDIKGIAFDGGGGDVHGVGIAAHVKAIPQETEAALEPRAWTVRAIHPAGYSMPVFADGEPLRAFEEPGNRQVMDVKAVAGTARTAVKVAADGSDRVVAIRDGGAIVPVRAQQRDGGWAVVRAVARDGHVFHLKAILGDGTVCALKALSVDGFLHDVKGIELLGSDVEGNVGGAPFRAHVKALPQVPGLVR